MGRFAVRLELAIARDIISPCLCFSHSFSSCEISPTVFQLLFSSLKFVRRGDGPGDGPGAAGGRENRGFSGAKSTVRARQGQLGEVVARGYIKPLGVFVTYGPRRGRRPAEGGGAVDSANSILYSFLYSFPFSFPYSFPIAFLISSPTNINNTFPPTDWRYSISPIFPHS